VGGGGAMMVVCASLVLGAYLRCLFLMLVLGACSWCLFVILALDACSCLSLRASISHVRSER